MVAAFEQDAGVLEKAEIGNNRRWLKKTKTESGLLPR